MSERIKKVQELLCQEELDCVVVHNSRNRRYISGFSGSAGLLVVFADKLVLFTDFRYVEQAREEAPECNVVQHGASVYDDLKSLLADCQKIGYEDRYVTVAEFNQMVKTVGDKQWLPMRLDVLREVKDDAELFLLAKAASILDRAFARLLNELSVGMSELEVAALLEYYLRQEGAAATSFSTIVASGERSSLPHGQPTEKKLAIGDFVTIDFGAVYDGYCSDMTRTFVMGKADDKQKELYDIVLSAQLTALSFLRPGVTGKQADAKARDIICAAGYGQFFGHGTGHSLGLAIHEEPRLSPTCETVLQPGMVVTVEPGIYIPGWGGLRIEDMAVITGGGAQILTATDKQLLELGS